MAIAFLLINADLSSEDKIVGELRKIPNVKEAYAAYGVYDIVARVEAESMEKLKEIITSKIRRLDNVRSTLTMIVVDIGRQQRSPLEHSQIVRISHFRSITIGYRIILHT